MIGAVGSTTQATLTGTSATTGSTAASSALSLLPPPSEAAADPLAMMYLIESKNQQIGISAGTKSIEGKQQDGQKAFQKELTAIQQQDQAAKHKSFWDKLGSICGDVAKVAGVVASIAAAVATCGAASPLAAVAVAGAVLSTAGFADSQFGILQKLGVNSNLAGILDAGMSIGGAVTSVGAGLLSGGQAAASTASTVSKVAGGVGGVGQVGQGAGTIGSAYAQRDEDTADANEEASEVQQANLQRLIMQTLGEMKDADQKQSQTLQTITSIKGTQDQTLLIAASGGSEGTGS